jgi:sugar-specific transcriptional regulator TrmB
MTDRKKRTKIPTQQADLALQQKLDKLAELQNGVHILNERINSSKKDLINHFEQNPHLKVGKYTTDDYLIRYIDRKVTDSISQKLLISGLAQYFQMKGVTDIKKEIATALQVITSQRHSHFVPNIDIKKKHI